MHQFENIMKILNLLSLLVLLTVSSFVQSEGLKNQKTIGEGAGLKDSTRVPAYIDTYSFNHTLSTWYAKINIKELRNSNLIKFLQDSSYQFSQNSTFSFQNSIPSGIQNINIFGNSLKRSEDVTLIFYGDFSNETLLNFLANDLYIVNNKSQLTQSKSKIYNGHNIYAFEVLNSKKKKYAARLLDGSFIVSTNIRLIRPLLHKSLLHPKHNFNQKVDKTNQVENRDLFVFNLNTEVALENMALNLEEDDYILKSQLFNKTRNILATAHVDDSKLIINSIFTSKTPEIALQIEKIINGISAIKTLSEDDPKTMQSQLLNNMTVNRDEKNVHINTAVLFTDLKK